MARLIVTHHARRRLRERGGTPEEVKPVLSKLFTLAVRDGTRRVALTTEQARYLLCLHPRRGVAEMVTVLAPDARMDHHPEFAIIPAWFLA